MMCQTVPDREVVERRTNWRLEMEDLIDELNGRGIGLLLTVDEISSAHEDLRSLIIVFQHFATEGRDVALLLAGLPSNASALLRDDDISFLRRAFQRELEPIDINDVEIALSQTIEGAGRRIESDALIAAAEGTMGFAFMIQLVGYFLWRQHPGVLTITTSDAKMALTQARREMDRAVFEPTFCTLTGRELQFLQSMTLIGRPTIRAVAKQMGITPNNAMKLRARLEEHGLVMDKGRGALDFAMPFLREYLGRYDESR